MEEVIIMEQAVAEMEKQLKDMHMQQQRQPLIKQIKLEPNDNFDPDADDDDADRFQLTITQNEHGLSFQTSIQTASDIFSFLTKTLRCFSESSSGIPTPMHSPLFYTDRTQEQITISNQNRLIERMIYSMFLEKHETRKPQLLGWHDFEGRRQFKLRMIESYFNCLGLVNPTLCIPWFKPIFLANPDSLISTAIAAILTYTNCCHVVHLPPSMTREELAESFRQEAKQKLHEVLLEEEATVFTAATLFFLAQCALIVLEHQEARIYLHMAWQMIVELRKQYAPVQISSPLTYDMVMAESFRRTFYTIRYLNISTNSISDDFTDYTAMMQDYGLGLPTLLENEVHDVSIRNSIEMFRYLVVLHVFQTSGRVDNIKYQLFSGKLKTIKVMDVTEIENQLLQFWRALPEKFRISSSPYHYVDVERINNLENPLSIYMINLYYSFWIMVQTRMMRAPSSTDLAGANLQRLDGERAILIVSVACDALAHLSQALYYRLPCLLELHWLLIASGAMTLLQNSKNANIRDRAKENLQMTLYVIERRLQQQTSEDDNETYHSLDTAELTSSSSTSSSSESENFYFGEFKKTLYNYFDNKEQCK